MFKALFNIIMDLTATVIQLVCWPLNQAIEVALPNLSEGISWATTGFSVMFNNITWAVNILPSPVVSVLSIILACEIAKHTIYVQTHTLIKVWNILQKIKFW